MGDIGLLVVGLLALVGGAELLVRGGSRLAARMGVSPIVIGLTIVSIGTSAPELAIGFEAALQGNGPLAVGNVAGTNVVNLLLILGLSAALRPLVLASRTVRIDLPMMAAAAILLLVLALDGSLSRLDGGILLVGAVAYVLVVVRESRKERAAILAEFSGAYGADAVPRGGLGALRDGAWLVVGIAVVVIGADWLVDGAVGIARAYAVPEAVIGLTVVAIGTSAPELVTTIVSTIRGDRDIAIGNLIGSSVLNIALILGLPAIVAPLAVTPELVRIDLPVMAAVTLLCIPVFVTGRRVTRAEGVAFVLGYVGYLAYLLIART